MKIIRIISVLFILISSCDGLFSQIRDRSQIPEKYKWDLTDLYLTDEAWTESKNQVLKKIELIPSFKNTLAESSSNMLDCLSFLTDIQEEMRRLGSYTWNKSRQDTRNYKYQVLSQETNQMYGKYNSYTAFIEPEILKIDESTIKKFINNEPALKPYSFYLNDLMRRKKYTFSENEEKLIAETGQMVRAPSTIYNVFMNTEFTGEINNYIRTLSALMDAKINVDVYNTRVRGYKDCLEMTLYPDNIPVEVFHNLISNANNNLDKFYRYLNIRKRLLGVDTLNISDLSSPLVSGFDKKYDIEEAKELIMESLQPLGQEYISVVKKAFMNRWIDIYPTLGKRSNAYGDFGAYQGHPYILLNFMGTFQNMSTLTHEIGHAVHTYLSDRNQAYPNAFYSTFVAEISSLVNEELLKKKLLKDIKDDDLRLYYLLETIESSIFNRVQVSEFELSLHREVENGNNLSADVINGIYLESMRKYYGHDQGICIIPDNLGMNWAFDRLLFLRAYPIYRYATSHTAASILAEKIFNKKEGVLEKYLDFLSAGGSDYPIDILKKAGVDLTSSESFEKTMDSMERSMEEIEKILDKKGIK
ncbi:M3 family oligoendopeptidase [Bacteroidota bacterium]